MRKKWVYQQEEKNDWDYEIYDRISAQHLIFKK